MNFSTFPNLDKNKLSYGWRVLTGIIILLTASITTSRAAFTFDNIDFWVEHSSVQNAANVSSAALVIDWNDGRGALAWGFRWDSAVQDLSQADILQTIALSDPRFSCETLYDGAFLESFTFNADDGSPIRHAANILGSGEEFEGDNWFVYSNLELNAARNYFKDPYELTGNPWAQGNDPRDFMLLTPVGMTEVPVTDGMWAYWAYAYWSENGDYAPSNVPWTEPTAVSVVPEPHISALLMAGSSIFLLRRRRRNS